MLSPVDHYEQRGNPHLTPTSPELNPNSTPIQVHELTEQHARNCRQCRKELRGLLSQKAAERLMLNVGSAATSGASSPPDSPSPVDIGRGFLPLPGPLDQGGAWAD